MKTKAKVSVVVPIYNKEKYMEKCIESIRSQTYDNIEIILVDDGSTDRSPQIVDQKALMDERVVTIHQKNAGEGAARNTGIQTATGDYVLFVDADDYIDTTLIEDAVCIAEIQSADCIVFGTYIEDEKGKYRTTKSWTDTAEWTAGTKEFLYDFFLYGRGDTGTSACNKLFSLEVIRKNQLKFSDLKIGADTIFCIEYGRVSKHWVRMKGHYYHYIQWDDSVMHKTDISFEKKLISLMNAYDEFAEKNGMFDYLKPAIHCLDVSDIFTIMKNYYLMDTSVKTRINRMKTFMKDTYCQEKMKVIDYKKLTRKNKIAYLILRNRWSLMMFLLTHIYHIVYE